jgi:hypothetical protein
VPGHSGYQQFSNKQISDASYIRLKQITLDYNVPSVVLKRVGIEQAKVFIQGLNLWTLTKYNGLDPEVNSIGPSTYGTYPNSRQITAGLNLNF